MSRKFKVTAGLLILIAIIVYFSFLSLTTHVVGVHLEPTADGSYAVSLVEEGTWGKDHVQLGDIIVSVNGSDPSQIYVVRNFHQLEGVSEIVLQRTLPTGEPQEISLEVEKGIAPEHFFLYFGLPFTAMLLFIGLSIFIYVRKKEDPAAIQLIFFFISIGLAYFVSYPSALFFPTGRIIMGISITMVPMFFIQFMNQYLLRFGERFLERRIIIGLYILLIAVNTISAERDFSDYRTNSYSSIALLAFFTLSNAIIIYKLIEKYIKNRHGQLRSLFKLTLAGQTIAFAPFVLLYAVPQMFGILFINPVIAASFLLALPIVYLYMFMTDQLFDIDFLLNRFLYYGIVAFFPTLIITGLIVLLLNQGNESQGVTWVRLFLTIFVLITLLLYGKEIVDIRLRPRFSKDLYNYQGSLDRFATRISRVMKRADLETVLEQEITSILPVKKVAFIEFNRTRIPQGPMASFTQEEWDATMEVLSRPNLRLNAGETIVVPSGLCVVIGHKNAVYHVLWLGHKVNQTQYNRDEIGWLKTLANYSAIVYENLYLIEGLLEDLESQMQQHHDSPSWVLRLIFSLSEKERRRLASDLHDSALQDQLIWYRKLESTMVDYPMAPELKEQLEPIKEGLLDVIHQIRETCNELRPPLLKEMGIVEALEQLFQEAQIRSNFVIKFDAQPFTKELNDDQILAIYRIVQELLQNASKHAKASEIEISLLQDEEIHFHYRDNGIGMEISELSDSFQHMGLSGIKERVRSLDGHILFRSHTGMGFEVRMTIPLNTKSESYEIGGMQDDTNLVS